jgi:SAM-dependent methyltransferase
MSLRDAWRAESANWIRFAQTPGHDRYYYLFNLPTFLELLPTPGRLTVDIGCGEGRLGRELQQRGHRVAGFDYSEAAIRAMRQTNSGDAGAVGDAGHLPLRTASADLATAFMSLHDMDDPVAAVREISRVLTRGGSFCFALLHPFLLAGEFTENKDSFVIAEPYWNERRHQFHSARDGVELTFWQMHRPLGFYTGALEAAGLRIEALREPRPDDDVKKELGSTHLMPVFLHGRAIKP